jgi:hypothetical protein
MASNFVRRGVSGGPGRRNRHPCSDLQVSFEPIFCNEQAVYLAGSGKPVKNVKFCNHSCSSNRSTDAMRPLLHLVDDLPFPYLKERSIISLNWFVVFKSDY